MSNGRLLTELALRQGIQSQMDDIVWAATQAALLLRGKDSKMEKNQIRNVLNVADESGSVAVVTNFIRYQIGRSRTGQAWQHGRFGLRVIHDLEEPQGAVVRAAAQAAQVARKELERRDKSAPETLVKDAHRELMRYYLGYLNRAFSYGNGTFKGAWEELGKAARIAVAG